MPHSVARYSDEELEEFKSIIEKKLDRASAQLASLQEQILEITENSSDEHGGDWVDDSSINNDVEMLNNMAIRQRMYVRELENALVRIRNKSYGICSVTGELIDKRRLLAVPTTTKSLAAKTVQGSTAERKPTPRPERRTIPKKPATPKVITKIIRKSASKPIKPDLLDEDDDLYGEDEDLYMEDQDPIRKVVDDLEDLDSIPDKSSEIDDLDEDEDNF